MKKRHLISAAVFAVFVAAVSVFYVIPTAELIKLLTPYYVDGVSNTRERFGSDNDGGYIVPVVAVKNADAVMSYGIADNVSFEMCMIKKFNIDVYAFDCGITEAPEKNDRLHFFPECIGSDEFIYKWQTSTQKISSYNDQLKRLGLERKRIFLKMDIEGSEYESFEGIPDSLFLNIQGMSIEIHSLQKIKTLAKAIKLLKTFNKYFVLIHVHGNNYGRLYPTIIFKKIPKVIELTYINKRYVASMRISDEKFPTALDRPNWTGDSDLILDYWK